MAASEPILIAGAGIGGLATALALAARGIPAHVIERRPRHSEAGAGIQIGPNGQRILAALGVAEFLAPEAATPDYLVVHEGKSGRELQRLPLGDWIARRHGAPYWVCHRRHLQAALLEGVRRAPLVQVTLGAEATHFEADDKGVRLHAAGGTTFEGRALVGADGAFSRVKSQLLAVRPPRFAGRTAARTVLARGTPGSDALPWNAVGIWLAPKAHVVHYPVSGGREMAVVVVREEPWAEHGWSAPIDREAVLGALRDAYAPRLADGLSGAAEWHRWALFEADPLPAFANGPVAVLGDAAHPTLPFMAQGGVMALEDAVTLAEAVTRSRQDVTAAFAAYSTARVPRTAALVARATRNGRIYHMSGVAAHARNIAMAAMGAERIMTGFDWVYGWRAA